MMLLGEVPARTDCRPHFRDLGSQIGTHSSVQRLAGDHFAGAKHWFHYSIRTMMLLPPNTNPVCKFRTSAPNSTSKASWTTTQGSIAHPNTVTCLGAAGGSELGQSIDRVSEIRMERGPPGRQTMWTVFGGANTACVVSGCFDVEFGVHLFEICRRIRNWAVKDHRGLISGPMFCAGKG